MASTRRSPSMAAETPPSATRRSIADIAAERERQVEKEGWDHTHDAQHDDFELTQAAACYAQFVVDRHDSSVTNGKTVPHKWPWDEEWWKPKDARRNLVRAAALIAAELDRLNRRDKVPVFVPSQSAPMNTAIPEGYALVPREMPFDVGADMQGSEHPEDVEAAQSVYRDAVARLAVPSAPSSTAPSDLDTLLRDLYLAFGQCIAEKDVSLIAEHWHARLEPFVLRTRSAIERRTDYEKRNDELNGLSGPGIRKT